MVFIVEEYNDIQKSNYLAIMYNVFKHIDNTGKTVTELNRNIALMFIRKKHAGDKSDVVSHETVKCNNNELLMILPKITRVDEQDRSCIYISGASGNGKSFLVNSISKLYHNFYPQNKLFFLTTNNFLEDRSLTHSIYKPIKMDIFIDTLEEKSEEWSHTPYFKNCLMIYDDIGALKNPKQEKTLWKYIDMTLENHRKFSTSIIVISHISTNYRQTALITRESSWYCVFPQNLQVKSDRMLHHYLGLNKKQIDRICGSKSRWVAIGCKEKVIITQDEIYSLI